MDMKGRQIPLVTSTVPALPPFIWDSRVSALAMASAKRSNALPDVPSMSESGLSDFDVLNYFAIAAPAGTLAATVNALNPAINQVVRMHDGVARFKANAIEAALSMPAQLGQFTEAEYAAWRNVVKAQNLKIE